MFHPNLNYKELYNTSPCGYFCATLKGEIIECNNRFLEFTGYEQEEILEKKRFSDFLPAGSIIFLETHFLPILYAQGFIEEINFDLVKKDKSKLPVLVNSVIIKKGNDEEGFIQSTVFNISQRKNYEKELLLAKEKADNLSSELLKSNQELKDSTKLVLEQKSDLERLNKYLKNKNSQLSDFAHIISHNLRSPVFNLHCLLGFYEESTDTDDKKMLIDTIKDVADQMDETLNELIDSLKIQKEFYVSKETLIFEDILQKILIMLSGDIKKTNAIITFDFTQVEKITYSKVYLKSAMLNLLSNAIKYRSPKRIPEIHFQTIDKTDEIILAVTDNGLGIDINKHRNNLFGFNKTFHNHPDSKGVGLYMTRVQIEAMGGAISVNSQVDKGSVFEIVFQKNL